MGQPAARINDMHTCPMVTGLVPHVGGPIIMGSPTVITAGMPQARVTDQAMCAGGPDVIAKGSATVMVNGLPAARIGDLTVHGGVIVTGCPTVLIGDLGLVQPVTPALPATAPGSKNLPAVEKIANDPVVAAEIDKAWKASNPNGPGKKQEKGFWVMKDDKTGALSVVQFPDNGTNDSLTPGPVPVQPGKSVAAFFHTHPNTAAEGYVSEPSDADKKFAKAVGAPGIIRSHDGMYYF